MALSAIERHVMTGLAVGVVFIALAHEMMELADVREAVRAQLLDDHYTVLGIQDSSSLQEIKTAYRRATSQFRAKPNADDERLRQARLASALEILTNSQTRTAYDQRRKLVHFVVMAMTCVAVLFPVCFIGWSVNSFLKGRGNTEASPDSFAGQVVQLCSKTEVAVHISIKRGSDSLGLRVNRLKSRGALELVEIAQGKAVDVHNKQIRQNFSDGSEPHVHWRVPELWEGDIITEVNGCATPDEMMRELGTKSDQTTLCVTRSMRRLLPHFTEVNLRRASVSEPWGAELRPSTDNSGTLELTSKVSGALATWNEANPSLQVRTGDRIIAVDRELGLDHLVAALKSKKECVLLVLRGVSATPRPLEANVVLHKREGQKLGIRIGAVLDSPVRGAIIDAGGSGLIVVKEIVPGYLVDEWNKRPGPKVMEGAVVVSINGKKQSSQFFTELSKPVINLCLRPPRGVVQPNEPREVAFRFAPRARSSYFPCHRRRSFAVKLRESVSALHYEFQVHVSRASARARGSSEKVGLVLDDNDLTVMDVKPGGLIDQHNGVLADSRHKVCNGDRIVSVNSASAVKQMIHVIKDEAVEDLAFSFSRPASMTSLGVWEIEVEKRADEGWGMELNEHPSGLGLTIGNITEGLALDRWNRASKWVQPGDVIVGCEPDVGVAPMLQRLRTAQRVRFTILRWFGDPSCVRFEVILMRRAKSEFLGIKLEPSGNKTILSEVMAGGLLEQYNRAASIPAAAGDEVEEVNGETDPSRFGQCSQASRVVLRLVRRTLVDTPSARDIPDLRVTQHQGSPDLKREILADEAVTAPTTSSETPELPLEPTRPGVDDADDWDFMKDDLNVLPEAVVANDADGWDFNMDGDRVEVTHAHEDPGEPDGWDFNLQDPDPVIPDTATAQCAVPAAPSPSPSPSVARDNLLLRAEVEQLKASVALAKKDSSAISQELADLRVENERLQAKLAQSTVQDALRAEVLELRDQKRHLQDATARLRTEKDGLVAASSRLVSENRELRQRMRRRPSGDDVTSGLQPLADGIMQLRELASSLDQILAGEIDAASHVDSDTLADRPR
uniref:J domain-containing protein n=1 Tax=Noctiluca scintillans TaxID=2966 RepID=A0A7S0ZQF8_NOCSC|mmetsp:Transcript_14322/g.38995  ORF Transcript_14322/g.38995 Transcript_14322/m.38995 type:complete len:1071 (+) Transcript_14322:64-3276(+)